MAVVAVAWSHWGRAYPFSVPFGAGVHLFYVLSGFLITGILLRLREAGDRRFAIRAFYARRALRIFPAFYLALALAALAAVPPVRETWAWHAAYLSNVWIYVGGVWPGTISHFWSLAVEEQFYLVWPTLIVFAPARLLVPVVCLAIASAPLFRWWLAELGQRESFLALLTPGCMDSLGVGALLATMGARAQRQRALILTLGLAGWLPLVAAGWLAVSLPSWLLALKQTFQALVFGWLVLGGAAGFAGWPGRLLSARPLLYLGRISYGLYLAHGFAGDIVRGMLALVGVSAPPAGPWRLALLAGVTILLASASWHFLEAPLNGLKSRVPYEPSARPERDRRIGGRRAEGWA